MNASWRAAVMMMAGLAVARGAEPAAPRERQVTVEAKPEFRKVEPDTLFLEIPGEDGKKVSLYWPVGAPRPATLSKERSYRVEYIAEESAAVPGLWINAELFRFRDGEQLLYDASRCAVHGMAMERKAVTIVWGLPRFVPGEIQARQKDFPNAGLANGGCMPMPDRPLAWKWVCPTCKEKEAEFMRSVGKEK